MVRRSRSVTQLLHALLDTQHMIMEVIKDRSYLLLRAMALRQLLNMLFQFGKSIFQGPLVGHRATPIIEELSS